MQSSLAVVSLLNRIGFAAYFISFHRPVRDKNLLNSLLLGFELLYLCQ